jgi:hypothetical protein
MENQANKIITELIGTIIISAIAGFLLIYIFMKLIGVEAMLLGFLITGFTLLFLATLNLRGKNI